jgi:lambda family phage portal protein
MMTTLPARKRRGVTGEAAPPPRQGFLQRLFARQPDPSPGIRFGAGCHGYRDTAYSGASTTRKQMANWLPMRATADGDLLPDLGMLVARARDLDRNNGVAAGAFQTCQDNTVGIGLRLSPSPDYNALGKTMDWAQAWGRDVTSLWRSWADTTVCDVAGRLTFAEQTKQVFRSWLENGEALCLPLWMQRDNTPFKTCMQLVDSDRLSNPQFAIETLNLRGGVEMDDFGKPLAYYIRELSEWPWMWTGFSFASWKWDRIPAETGWGRKRVLHIYIEERPDQTRGKPILTPVLEQFRMLDAYQRTELQSSIVNSLVAGVIETPLDPAALHELMGGDVNRYFTNKNDYRIQLEGGTFIPLYPGDKMQPFLPARPAPQFSSFVETVLRQIGNAMGLPYELVMKDFSKTNYSSARAAMLEAWRNFMNRRTQLATYWCAPVYALWFEEAVNAGLIDAPNFYDLMPYYLRAKWIGPGRGQIDPVKEAEGAQIRMSSMISTLELECAEQGLDWQEVLEQRALEQNRLKELGLYVAPPPAKPKGEPAEPEQTPVREPV